MRALVAGWFSFADGHATAGDLLSRDVLQQWLGEAGIEHDFAAAPPFTGGVNWRQVDPERYTHLIFVCGPFGPKELEAEILLRFVRCRLIGVNLSMDVPLETWNPFDLLIERDSSAWANPDIVFGSRTELPPVVGICLVEDHPEALVGPANRAIGRLIAGRELATVRIDTRLDINEVGLRSPGEVEAFIGRMDAIVTTRLHGLVLALKNGVPALAVDAVPGGGKIARQCAVVGWPHVLTLDRLDDAGMEGALTLVLTQDARRLAADCAARADEALQHVRARLVAGLAADGAAEITFRKRSAQEQIGGFVSSLRELLARPDDPVPPPPRSRWRRLRDRVARIANET